MVPVSRDHHQALLLSWKLERGIAKAVEAKRMSAYCRWFWDEHLLPHFMLEESFIFPVLGNDHPLIVQALADHEGIKALIHREPPAISTFAALAALIKTHVRLEERSIFTAVQQIATPEQFADISKHHSHAVFIENTADEFWI